jgi:hypothetical protein
MVDDATQDLRRGGPERLSCARLTPLRERLSFAGVAAFLVLGPRH